MAAVLALFLVAVSVGMSNLAASIAIGVSGVDARTRLQVGLIFGLFESGMPVLGLLIGAQVAAGLGPTARWIGAGLLIAVGLYTLVSAARSGADLAAPAPAHAEPEDAELGSLPPARAPGVGRLLVSGLALSVDNLVVGFALGTYRTSIAIGVIVIGAVSVAMSLVGLELGAGIGKWAGRRGEQLAGLMLISVGIAIASGALS
ncbi:MAG TPA: manganese efflux pump [Streptosporangiaceae bacterium]|nr:manganese efflux pump [Streptosporangiaceae bacterium]